MIEDLVLTWKFNRGEKTALEAIYEKYKNDLVTLATALLYDNSVSEDVVHDVFVSFVRSCGNLRLTGSLKGYLTSCVVNNVRNRNKAGQRCKGIELDEMAQIVSGSNTPDTSLIFGEKLHKLARALYQLPYEQREVLFLHLYSGMKFRAIAELHRESISAIQGRYRHALEKLRSLLNSEVER
jgi:RNA polymerase sigma factor (sigma-70 family)